MQPDPHHAKENLLKKFNNLVWTEWKNESDCYMDTIEICRELISIRNGDMNCEGFSLDEINQMLDYLCVL